MKGIISGFLFGCISLAVVSIILGIISPKPPESFNIIAPDSSQFSNSINDYSSTSKPLAEVYYSPSGITEPNTNRKLNRKSSIESTSKLVPVIPKTSFSSILKIDQKLHNSPAQPKISDKNMDNRVKFDN